MTRNQQYISQKMLNNIVYIKMIQICLNKSLLTMSKIYLHKQKFIAAKQNINKIPNHRNYINQVEGLDQIH